METNNYDPIEEQFNKIRESQKKTNQSKKKVEYDVKNYLNIKLDKKETEKQLTVRILYLTPESKTPFAEVHTHYLPSEERSYVCAKKTKDIPENIEKTCPFCDIRDEAKEQQKGANEATWNKLKEIYKQNDSILNYVVRVVDRDDQDFGIKFWKISQSTYETIIDIYKNNKKDGINIFDKYEGKDLVVTIKKKEGKNKISSILPANKQTPIAKTEEEINSLITDDKLWTDVYSVKPYEYLELVINGKKPFFDKTIMRWVEKKEETTNEEETQDEYVNGEYSDSEENSEDLPF